MAISVAPDFAKITITKRPTVQTATIGANTAVFDCTNVAASGQVTLNGAGRRRRVAMDRGLYPGAMDPDESGVLPRRPVQ